MTEPLLLAPKPCNTCPYVRATPAGIWSADEYRKLPEYDRTSDGPGPLAPFHCHQETITGKATVCRGWLAVQADCTAVRLLLATNQITRDQLADAAAEWPNPELYGSGAEACAAGLAAVKSPPAEAKVAVEKLLRRGKFGLR